jgi:hypothetical protein
VLNPVLPVKPLVGALAYVYGVMPQWSHTATRQLVALQRQQFKGAVMLRAKFEGTPPKAVRFEAHADSRVEAGLQWVIDPMTFKVIERPHVGSDQAGDTPGSNKETPQ